jgi:hypothetical protein
LSSRFPSSYQIKKLINPILVVSRDGAPDTPFFRTPSRRVRNFSRVSGFPVK